MRDANPGVGIVTMALTAVIASARDAHAYIGPGVGMTAIGSLVALVAAVLFAVIGFLWYPIKRLRTVLRARIGSGRESEKASA